MSLPLSFAGDELLARMVAHALPALSAAADADAGAAAVAALDEMVGQATMRLYKNLQTSRQRAGSRLLVDLPLNAAHTYRYTPDVDDAPMSNVHWNG